jgi:glycosyltransferase involved in cell wall biosynthesis
VTTRAKRNWLIDQSVGKYFVFIDDDDLVPCYYVKEILKAAETNPDCITFIGYMTTDGKNAKPFELRLGEKYEERNGKYFRFPNHITPMRRETVAPFRFPDITLGEDSAFAYAIMGAGALKTEIHIHKDMYIYDYLTTPH